MENMFRSAKNFNQDISKWDVSRVTNMENMFRNAERFNVDISCWKVSKVRYMQDRECITYIASSFL